MKFILPIVLSAIMFHSASAASLTQNDMQCASDQPDSCAVQVAKRILARLEISTKNYLNVGQITPKKVSDSMGQSIHYIVNFGGTISDKLGTVQAEGEAEVIVEQTIAPKFDKLGREVSTSAGTARIAIDSHTVGGVTRGGGRIVNTAKIWIMNSDKNKKFIVNNPEIGQ